jgi:hypothetical protein
MKRLHTLRLALALATVLLPAYLADSTMQGADEHQPSANYYAVSQPAWAWWAGPAEQGHAPAIDHPVLKNLGDSVPEDALLQIADSNKADFAENQRYIQGADCFYAWYPLDNATSKVKSFIHKNRCDNGKTGTTIKSSTGTRSYKKCTGIYSTLTIGKAFNQPAYLCEQTCDNSALCAAYATASDGTTDRCWILYSQKAGPSGIHSYWRISD